MHMKVLSSHDSLDNAHAKGHVRHILVSQSRPRRRFASRVGLCHTGLVYNGESYDILGMGQKRHSALMLVLTTGKGRKSQTKRLHGACVDNAITRSQLRLPICTRVLILGRPCYSPRRHQASSTRPMATRRALPRHSRQPRTSRVLLRACAQRGGPSQMFYVSYHSRHVAGQR